MNAVSTIWVIEDDESIAQCLTLLLESAEYRVRTAGSLGEARALSGVPNLVLLDFLLPDGNGVAFLPELSERFPGTRVILLTAQDRVGTSRFPAHVTYQSKPFHNHQLLELIRSELARSGSDSSWTPPVSY